MDKAAQLQQMLYENSLNFSENLFKFVVSVSDLFSRKDNKPARILVVCKIQSQRNSRPF